ncbi:MAG: HAMP domain-containing protein [Chitinophagaceae bacterium]|nr:HAMP domain-containing protein [Chitinophagaceae bacterium]
MITSVRNKIRLGSFFLFLLVLLSCGVGVYNLVRLKNDATLILKNNYESLDYCHTLQQLLDTSLPGGRPLAAMDSVLQLQERNVTEPGEQEATRSIRDQLEALRTGSDTVAVTAMRASIQQVLRLNMQAIETKNNRATATANKTLTYISLLAGLVLLIGISFSYNFPSILTQPIQELTEGLQEISRKNYRHRLHLTRHDEFGQMAQSFNTMAERLEYFEHSNLNKIIFEKTRAEAVINSLKEASIGIDKSGMILFANNQALQLLGLQAKDIVGRQVAEVSSRNDLLRFLLEDKGKLPFKVVLDNRENYFVKEEIEIDQEGAENKVIVLQNITSFKELDVARTHFIATVSHELKTPLASSDFSLKLLENPRTGTLTPDQQELVHNLRQDNQRMLRILSELLNMAQVETGRIELHQAAADAGQIVKTAIQSLAAAARARQVDIRFESPADLRQVMADAEKTGWVLNNLLSNAIRYSPGGGVVAVELISEPDRVVFSVKDQGPGIPAQYAEKVFDRFFTLPDSKNTGTGLGLAISKEFIEAQGGQIWVDAAWTNGSDFRFSLPVV